MADRNSIQLAEAILAHLMLGSEVIGIRFLGPQLLLSGSSDVRGEPFVNLESRWTIFDRRPNHFPTSEAELPDLDPITELKILLQLREKVIEKIEILNPPHLVLTFDDDAVLFLNGISQKYESWQAGQSFSDDDVWLVVAAPGGSLSIWAPEKFVDHAV